ncbi:Aste57867_16859 [Aphanomyces stellatus]|uniref:Aste57867_16859 protein n=1 Tax=Aphanomyces stellatus TaxID=120398 RepID=A0A485L7C4_9STRA|nr:hypothetical protein As57867_016801 [Aphanomyces stellatus]VFT93623.1 Aste57867_16859 [Aphanomyces stellatus]
MLTTRLFSFLACLALASSESPEAFCGTDHSQPIPCLANVTTVRLGRAVARLRLARGFSCTGWLFGSEGHLVTNAHCVPSEEAAAVLVAEFDAACPTCSDPLNDRKWECPGVFAANSSSLIFVDEALDVALVKLNVNPGVDMAAFGYLQARATSAVDGEPVFGIGHPATRPKRVSMTRDGGATTTITNTSATSRCNQGGQAVVAFNLDIDGLPTGWPVLGATDNKVVALYNCGGGGNVCGANTGTKMNEIVDSLVAHHVLPKDAVASKPSC